MRGHGALAESLTDWSSSGQTCRSIANVSPLPAAHLQERWLSLLVPFDERIALTIAQESGGGGAAAWRVSETLGNVETLGKTSRAWFREDMFQFSNSVEKLPYDHHELMAMVAPRALLVLGNPDYEWLADESGYVSCRAAHTRFGKRLE